MGCAEAHPMGLSEARLVRGLLAVHDFHRGGEALGEPLEDAALRGLVEGAELGHEVADVTAGRDVAPEGIGVPGLPGVLRDLTGAAPAGTDALAEGAQVEEHSEERAPTTLSLTAGTGGAEVEDVLPVLCDTSVATRFEGLDEVHAGRDPAEVLGALPAVGAEGDEVVARVATGGGEFELDTVLGGDFVRPVEEGYGRRTGEGDEEGLATRHELDGLHDECPLEWRVK